MNSPRVIRMSAEKVYRLQQYESVRLSVEVECPDLALSDDIAMRKVYEECYVRLDRAAADYKNKRSKGGVPSSY